VGLAAFRNWCAVATLAASLALAGSIPPRTAVARAGLAAGMSWEIQLSSPPTQLKDVEAYDFDLFETPQTTIDEMKRNGIFTICYFSAGSYEAWRADAPKLKEHRGRKLKGWNGEWWIDIRQQAVRDVMAARLDLAVAKGCDAVDPDNVDGYQNKNGLGLTKEDQIDYLEFLATEAHARGLAIGLKNSVELIPDLVDRYDFAVNEECFDYRECHALKPFTDADKPVFQIQYGDKAKDRKKAARTWCGAANDLGFSTLIKGWDLDAKGIDCRTR
jgi:hypothetical protein